VPTSTAHLHQVVPYNNADGFTGTYAKKGEQLFYLFRSPLRAAVVLTANPTAATYNAVFLNGASSMVIPAATTVPPTDSFPSVYLKAVDSTRIPHGLYLYGGGLSAFPDLQFFYLGTGDILSVTVTGATVSANVNFLLATKVNSVNSNVNSVEDVALVATGTASYTATSPGYVAVDFACTSGATTSVTVTMSLVVAAGDCFSHVPIPGAINHPNFCNQLRINSSSLLISNVSSALNVEGSIFGCSVTDGSSWYDVGTGSGGSADMTNRNDFFSGRAAKGIYTWLRPAGENPFAFRKAMESTGAYISDTTFMLDDPTPYQVMKISTSGVASSYPALDLLTRLDFALEYKTDDQWVELEVSPYYPSEVQDVLAVLARAPTFIENPLHFSAIKSFIGKATSFMRKHAVLIGKGLSAAFPSESFVIDPVSRFLQS